MKVIVKAPNNPAIEVEIENELEALQGIVGGYIECVPLTYETLIICNEEGKIHNLPYNFSTPMDHIMGTVIICGEEGEDFADVPITIEEFNKILTDWGNEV